MATLQEQIFAEQTVALKARDENRLSVLRMLTAALKNAEIEKRQALTEEEAQAVILRQVKQSQDALADFIRGERQDLVDKTKYEIAVLRAYLPPQLSAEEIKIAVQKILADNGLIGSKETGKIMGLVMKELKSKADGNAVKEIVSQLLGN